MAPDAFVCPITRDVMDRPVVAADGHSYEHDAVAKWLTRNARSPLTNAPMGPELVPNITLRKAIAEWREQPAEQPAEQVTQVTQVTPLNARVIPANSAAAAEAAVTADKMRQMRREICDLESRLETAMNAQRRSAREDAVVVRACRLYEAQYQAAEAAKLAAEKARVGRAAQEARHAAYHKEVYEREQENHRSMQKSLERGTSWER